MASCSEKIIHKSNTEKNTFSSQVFQCVAYITHKCELKGPILQELFLKWSTLSVKEKVLLNYIAFHVIEKNQLDLYTPIMQGFGYWNTLQDTEGACGFHENPLDFKFALEDEKRIFQIVVVIDKIISNILVRSRLSDEIRNFKIENLINCKGNTSIYCASERINTLSSI